MHRWSPFQTIRHFTTTYFALQARQNPSQTAKFFTNPNKRQTQYKPPPRAPQLLIPIGSNGHWYLLIRTKYRYTFIDSHHTGVIDKSRTNESNSKPSKIQKHIRRTPKGRATLTQYEASYNMTHKIAGYSYSSMLMSTSSIHDHMNTHGLISLQILYMTSVTSSLPIFVQIVSQTY